MRVQQSGVAGASHRKGSRVWGLGFRVHGVGLRAQGLGLRVEGDSGQTKERLPCKCRSPESQPPGAVLCRRHRWPERGLGVGVEGSGLGLEVWVLASRVLVDDET